MCACFKRGMVEVGYFYSMLSYRASWERVSVSAGGACAAEVSRTCCTLRWIAIYFVSLAICLSMLGMFFNVTRMEYEFRVVSLSLSRISLLLSAWFFLFSYIVHATYYPVTFLFS